MPGDSVAIIRGGSVAQGLILTRMSIVAVYYMNDFLDSRPCVGRRIDVEDLP